tara:strand:- start:755 stop:1081 length:327 start_codon:yes stop_codon:yes gene_type:complete
MNITESAMIGLLLLNLTVIILTGRAIINEIKNESYDLAQFMVKAISEQLPEAIGNAVQELQGFEPPNPLQQMAVEWMRNMMNQQPVTATITDIPRDQAGKFVEIDNQS